MVPASLSPITLYCDNSGAVAQSKELGNYGKGKHVERKFHIIRDIVQRGDVTVIKLPPLTILQTRSLRPCLRRPLTVI